MSSHCSSLTEVYISISDDVARSELEESTCCVRIVEFAGLGKGSTLKS